MSRILTKIRKYCKNNRNTTVKDGPRDWETDKMSDLRLKILNINYVQYKVCYLYYILYYSVVN